MNTAEKAANERYNRRTRALERLAAAHEAQAYDTGRIADALNAQAAVQLAGLEVPVVGNSRRWTSEAGKRLMRRASDLVERLR